MLVIGLVPILAAMVAAGVDTAVLFTHRRSLAADADAAALAAAQSADLQRFYSGDTLEELPLDCTAARRTAQHQLELSSNQGMALQSFVCNQKSVSLTVSAPTTLPFAHYFGIAPTIEVGANSAATSPLR